MQHRNFRSYLILTSIRFLFFIFLATWSGNAAAQEKSRPADPIAQLYAAGRKEGTVIVWGPTDAIIYQRMQAILDKQYPGIKIEHFESIPEPLVQRIIAESQAGKPAPVDIMQSGSLRALRPLIDRDMLAPYPGWETDFKLDAVYAGDRFVGAYNLTLPISYNSKLVSAKDAPKTWEDLADPKWKGKKIIIEARLVPFAMLGTEWGKARALELAKKNTQPATDYRAGWDHGGQRACRRSGVPCCGHVRLYDRTIEKDRRIRGLDSGESASGADFRHRRLEDRCASECCAIFCRLDGHAGGPARQIRNHRSGERSRPEFHRGCSGQNQGCASGGDSGNR